MKEYKSPSLAVDIIIDCITDNGRGAVLIERKNPPFGWALPGGFVDDGEALMLQFVKPKRKLVWMLS